MCLTGQQLRQNLRHALYGFNDELYAEVIGESAYEIVFGSGGPIRAIDIGRRTITRDNTKLADLENLVEKRRRRGTGSE
jgi:hypothetical protein